VLEHHMMFMRARIPRVLAYLYLGLEMIAPGGVRATSLPYAGW
jgi:hypothetical protein